MRFQIFEEKSLAFEDKAGVEGIHLEAEFILPDDKSANSFIS
ncbi:hypothetical protein L293_0650 [Acinetobacter gyllenbergii CIP 110306 = MTCC 11365]|uniref:Uncharacterized protein n=1 Tax=Acinetobacter gyllenbergii CIP 110306 = MTCC 11365 TaxID=1217657 RepID=A0A829HII4_9GAMM|nr:hypothetical protein F957_01156 [Acinetobacter gyllenbergii CIP 110306 = MTCC 11365]EPH36056.1 hypothetical protein L293_0650 [Acinetobacter gyllenbergii CIP 110306 = MTCC 11365]